MRRVREPDGRVHHSSLREMRRSPLHYRHRIECPREADTRAMLIGAAGDALIFGGRKVVIYEGKVRRGKEWDAFEAAHEGDIICNQAEHDAASGAAFAVLSDAVSGPIVKAPGTEAQRVLAWESWGLECGAGIPGPGGRGGFDLLGQGFVTDLKITNDASPRALERQIWAMGWVTQMAFYVDGCKALGMGPMDARLICVEATAPHPVTVLELSPEVIDFARRSLSRWTEMLKACEASDAWPAYVQESVEVLLPEWAQEALDSGSP